MNVAKNKSNNKSVIDKSMFNKIAPIAKQNPAMQKQK